MTEKNETVGQLEWTISVPILRNSVILKQLGIAIGIPFGILLLFLLSVQAFYGVALIAILFLLTYLFIRIVWGGNYEVGFELDKTGIRNYTMKKQARKNRIINTLAVVLGLFSGKPAVAGAGILAQSRQEVSMKWKNIKKVKYLPQKQAVILKGGFTENIAVFCTPMNYAEVEAFIKSVLHGRQDIRKTK